MEIPSRRKLFFSFLRLGVGAFGGPAMVAYIHGMAVNKFRWLDEETFRKGVALCQTLPGATAMQVAAYVGLKAKGLGGALVSFGGFGLPAFVMMLGLSALYRQFSVIPQVLAVFSGLQVAVIAIVLKATLSFGRQHLRDYRDCLVALATSLFFWLGVSPFVVILAVAASGIICFRNDMVESSRGTPGAVFHVKHVAVLLSTLFLGMLALILLDKRLFGLALLMAKVDLFAFGGGFASLPLLFHQVVEVKGWMDSKTLMDGISLGQITPGPIVITATFVGYLVSGLEGAIVATLAIFAPSFLTLVLCEPLFVMAERTTLAQRALRGILASFVGLLLFTVLKLSLSIPWSVARVTLGTAAFVALVRNVWLLYIVLGTAIVSMLLFH